WISGCAAAPAAVHSTNPNMYIFFINYQIYSLKILNFWLITALTFVSFGMTRRWCISSAGCDLSRGTHASPVKEPLLTAMIEADKFHGTINSIYIKKIMLALPLHQNMGYFVSFCIV